MGVLRLRKRAMKSSSGMVRGSAPGPSYFVSGCDDGEASEAAGVDEAKFFAAAEGEDGVGVGRDGGVGGGDEQAAGHAEVDEELRGFSSLRVRSTTMVLPTRWTRSMRLPVRVSMISSGGDLKVWGLLLVCTATTVWPWMRAWTPLAMVSTSGSSGMPVRV